MRTNGAAEQQIASHSKQESKDRNRRCIRIHTAIVRLRVGVTDFGVVTCYKFVKLSDSGAGADVPFEDRCESAGAAQCLWALQSVSNVVLNRVQNNSMDTYPTKR